MGEGVIGLRRSCGGLGWEGVELNVRGGMVGGVTNWEMRQDGTREERIKV